jgi:DNA-damage-inducible protein J
MDRLPQRIMQDKSIPSEAEVPNAATIEAMEEARQGGLPSFEGVSALMSDLTSRD